CGQGTDDPGFRKEPGGGGEKSLAAAVRRGHDCDGFLRCFGVRYAAEKNWEETAISQFIGAFSSIQWQDIADIFLITFILYRLYLWIQGTRALRILIAL